MTDGVDLRSLLERVQKAQGPDDRVDGLIASGIAGWHWHGGGSPERHKEYAGHWVMPGYRWSKPKCECHIISDAEGNFDDPPQYTASIDDVVSLISELLPDWWWSCGYCKLSNDASLVPRASMAPDFRASPEAHALVNKSRKFDEGFHCDLRYGNVPIALLVCLLTALIAKAELEEGVGEF